MSGDGLAPGLPPSFDIFDAGQGVRARADWEAQLRSALNGALAPFLQDVLQAVLDQVTDPATPSLVAAAADGPDPGHFTLGQLLRLWAAVGDRLLQLIADLTGLPVTSADLAALRQAVMESPLPSKVFETVQVVMAVAHEQRWSPARTRETLRSALDPKTGAPTRARYVDETDPLRGLEIRPELYDLAQWTEQVEGEARTLATRTYNKTLYDTIAAHGEPLTKRWIAHYDDRTRPTHFAANAQRVQLHSPFMVGGYALLYPGDPAGPPGEIMRCRCSMTAWPVDPSLP